MSTTYDAVIRGGTIVDGTGSRAYEGDIGISRGVLQPVMDFDDPETLDPEFDMVRYYRVTRSGEPIPEAIDTFSKLLTEAAAETEASTSSAPGEASVRG